jgi:hypothetical protein
MSDDIDATKVDIDPKLFGELPDEPIEKIPEEYNGLISAQQEHEWSRQITLVSMLDACVHCDGPITERELRTPSGDVVSKLKCDDCGEAWVSE